MDGRPGMGTALYTRKLIEQLLQDDRFEWCLVHFDKVDDPLYANVREIIMPQVRLPFATRFVRTLLFFWRYHHESFDVIHWFQPRLYPFFWLAPARHIVVTAHGAGDITALGEFPLSRRMFNAVMKYGNRFIAAVIAVSEFGKEEIVEHYHVPASKVFVTYNGGSEGYTPLAKDEARRRMSAQYGISTPFILDVSRLEPHKNVAMLVEAYELLRHQHPVSHQLVVAGRKGYEAERTLELAQRSAYSADIRFLNYVAPEDLNALYAAADLFVFPSLNEGFGLPLVEAFASGTPVITSTVTALPEVSGDAAVLVDPTSKAALTEAMYRVLSDKSLYAQLVERGLARAKEFTWQKTARATADIYRILLT